MQKITKHAHSVQVSEVMLAPYTSINLGLLKAIVLALCLFFASSIAVASHGDGNGDGNGNNSGDGNGQGEGDGNGEGQGDGNGDGEGSGDSAGSGSQGSSSGSAGSSGGSGNGGNAGSSDGGNGSGGEGPGGGDSFLRSYFVSKPTYDRGKKVFYNNVTCDSCPYSDLELTPEAVRAVWKQLKADLRSKGKIGSKLTRKERRAAKAFLRKRFSL